jgi:hypothetical protein
VSQHQAKWTNVIYKDKNGKISGTAYIPLKDDEDQQSKWGNYEIKKNMNNSSLKATVLIPLMEMPASYRKNWQNNQWIRE